MTTTMPSTPTLANIGAIAVLRMLSEATNSSNPARMACPRLRRADHDTPQPRSARPVGERKAYLPSLPTIQLNAASVTI